MAITTLIEVKALLQITDSSKDGAIEVLIPIAADYVRRYCNRDFLNSDNEDDFPPAVKHAAVKYIGINLKSFSDQYIKSESITDHSTSYVDTVSDDLVKKQVEPLLKPFRKLSW